MNRFVIYLRVGHEDQGQPQVTLAAQERSIRFFLDEYADTNAQVIGRFCDRHPSKDSPDTRFQQALTMCRAHSAELLIARLDRLPPANTGHCAIFADPGVNLRVAMLPTATKAELEIHARLLAQEKAIHAWQALRSLDRRAELGLHRQRCATGKAAPEPASETKVPDQVAQIILPMRQRGATLRDIAEALNRTGLVTVSGTAWRPAQVSRILQLMQ